MYRTLVFDPYAYLHPHLASTLSFTVTLCPQAICTAYVYG